MARLAAARLLLLVSFAAAPAAHAHASPPEGLWPFVEDGRLVGGATSYGYLLDEEGTGTWRWTCEEAGPEGARGFAFLGGKIVVVPATRGLFASLDQGCSFSSVAPLEDRFVATVVRAGSDLAVLVAEPGADGALVRLDEELELVGAEIAVPGLQPEGMTHLGDGRFLVAGAYPGVGPGAAIVDVGAQAGAEVRAVALDAAVLRVRAVGTTLRAGAVEGLLGAERADGADILAVSPGGTPVLLRSFGAGVLPSPVRSVVDGGTALLLLLDDGTFLRSDGAGASTDEPTSLPGPSACLTVAEGMLLGCGALRDRDFLRSGDDGATWSSALAWADLAPRACPAGTAGGDTCSLLWGLLVEGYGIGAEPGSEPDADPGPPPPSCQGCASAPLAVVVVPCWLASRRRRRPRRRARRSG